MEANRGTSDVERSGEGISEIRKEDEQLSQVKRLLKRFGVAGFLFFLIKGVVLYILIPLGLFKWFGGC
ncbi:MAG: hypothetical protein KDD67_06340 [Ignavibacteriae bacterium]|nr:hypothetical protein [Ignavibacteriota bacterium]MCB9215554.1 hypothetical protein [Ignavibacteria bacterium]